MRKSVYLALAASALLVTACSTTPRCLEHQSYMDAKIFPPLKSPPGLHVPKPDKDMHVPDIASGPVGHYKQAPADTDADNPAARCLTTPPPMGAS